MKITLTVLGSSLEHDLDPRFGRARYFLIYDTETHFVEVIDNEANAPSGGAGIAAAQKLVDRQVEVVITGHVGPNALSVLRAAKLKLYQGITGTAKQNLEAFQAGKLNDLERFVPSHSGK